MLRRHLAKFLLAPFLPSLKLPEPAAKPKEQPRTLDPNRIANRNLKPGDVVVDLFIVEEQDGTYSLGRCVDTYEGTWGRILNIGKCPDLNLNAFAAVLIEADGVSLLKPLPIQKEPVDYDALREARYDIAGRRLGEPFAVAK